MSSVVVHNSPHIAITRSLSRSTYETFKLLKNLATTRRLKWEERKSYRSRTNVVASRAFSSPCQTRRYSTSCYELCTSCYELLRYNKILRPSSDELLREAYELLRHDPILKPRSDEFMWRSHQPRFHPDLNCGLYRERVGVVLSDLIMS